MPVPPPKILPRRKAPLLSMPEQHTMPSYTAGGHAGDPRHDPERGKSASGSDGSAKDGVVTRRAGKRREWDGSPTIGKIQPSYDKQFVRNWLKANWDMTGETPHLPAEVIDEIGRASCRERV